MEGDGGRGRSDDSSRLPDCNPPAVHPLVLVYAVVSEKLFPSSPELAVQRLRGGETSLCAHAYAHGRTQTL